MCIIAAKARGVEMPKPEYIHNMFANNDDGAGLMYTIDGKVQIEKGYMSEEAFNHKLNQLSEKFDLKDIGLVLHFRITTHGGTKPENCHPFPVTDSIGMLKKLKCRTDIGVAHNGIIDIAPRKGISDTMEYIASQMAPLKRAVPEFYKDRNLLEMISNAITSKMVIMNGKGEMAFIGDFREEDGVKYSNYTYAYDMSRKSLVCSKSSYDEWAPWSYYDNFGVKKLMLLDEMAGDYVITEDGEMLQDDFAIDRLGNVYWYDIECDCFERVSGATAFTGTGTHKKFDEKSEWVTEEYVNE